LPEPVVPPEKWYLDMPMNYDRIDGPKIVKMEDLSEKDRAETEAYFKERGVE